MRPNGIVVESEYFHRALGFRQADEPTLVETFVPQSAVDALDEAVLHRPPRLDELQRDAVLVRPLIDVFAAKFRSVVTHDHVGVPTNLSQLSLGPARFLDPDATGAAMLAVLTRLDVITIWVTVLLAVGLYSAGKLTKEKAITAGVLLWVLGTLFPLWGAIRQG